MVGREVLLEVDRRPAAVGDTVLDVDSLTVEDERDVEAVSSVSFSVKEGEVFGIAGVDGNGQTELVEAITGLTTPARGSVVLDDEPMDDRSRRERIEAGMAYIPEDRQSRGLVMDFDLVENGILGSQHSGPFADHGRIDWDEARDHAAHVVDEYDVRPGNTGAEAVSLSGGNQQKFVVGREFERDPRLMIATHPTRGVDIGSTEYIHERILGLRESDTAVLLVSSKLDEVQQLSDRLAVMYEGEIMAVVEPDAVTEEELGLLMAGEYPETIAADDHRNPEGER